MAVLSFIRHIDSGFTRCSLAAIPVLLRLHLFFSSLPSPPHSDAVSYCDRRVERLLDVPNKCASMYIVLCCGCFAQLCCVYMCVIIELLTTTTSSSICDDYCVCWWLYSPHPLHTRVYSRMPVIKRSRLLSCCWHTHLCSWSLHNAVLQYLAVTEHEEPQRQWIVEQQRARSARVKIIPPSLIFCTEMVIVFTCYIRILNSTVTREKSPKIQKKKKKKIQKKLSNNGTPSASDTDSGLRPYTL